MHKKTEIRFANETALRSRIREVRRRAAEDLPVRASPNRKRHLNDMYSTLKKIKNDWKMLFHAELPEF